MAAGILIFGASGHASVVIDAVEKAGRHTIVGLLDPAKPKGSSFLGYPLLGAEEDLPALRASGEIFGGVVALGDNHRRAAVVEAIQRLWSDFPFVSVVHPSVQQGREVEIGAGSVVLAGAILNTGAQVGQFCIVNTQASLDHGAHLGDFASLAPGVVVGGDAVIGDYTAVGLGAKVIQGIHIGTRTVIGAGATVLRNIPDGVVAYGTPARVIADPTPDI